MKAILGIILLLAGGAVMLVGIGMALLTLISMYAGVLNDPMSDAGPTPKQTSDTMIHWAIIGGVGAPFFVAGSILLKVTLFQKLMGLGRGREAKRRAGDQAIRRSSAPQDRYPTAMTGRGQSPRASSGRTPPR